MNRRSRPGAAQRPGPAGPAASMDQIALKKPNPKCRLFLKIDLYRDLAACVYLSEAPSPLRFLFGVVKQFFRFGIWSNTQCITPLDALHTNRSTPPPPTVTHCIDCIDCIDLYLFTQGRVGGGKLERR
jgi:hypothetical protein